MGKTLKLGDFEPKVKGTVAFSRRMVDILNNSVALLDKGLVLTP